MLTADSSPMPVEVPLFCEGKAHPRRVHVRTIPSRCVKSRIDAAAHVKPCDCRMLSTRMWIALMESRLNGRFADGGRRMFGEMAVLIHVHPRLVIHGDEFKVRVAFRALAVRMHRALCALDPLPWRSGLGTVFGDELLRKHL